MNKQWKHPFWENYQKDRITAKLIIKHGDGKETSSTATVGKYASDGSVHKDFDEIVKQNTLETIDANTKEREDRHKRRRAEDKKAHEESQQAQKLEDLFNSKLEVFEIESIKNSTNRMLKAKIRKSKSKWELMTWTTILMKEELENESKPE
jgi:hypothetical protein